METGVVSMDVPEVPEDWRHLVERDGGKRKATVMYYVDVSPLFTDSEKSLAKIRDVLRVFEENSQDVTVLWRQDSSIDKYLRPQKPEVWEDYRSILEDFTSKGFGIVDDTAAEDEVYFSEIKNNYHGPAPTPGERRSIEFCDAFYGDGGYLANCFRNKGKPVMIQNADILSHTDEGREE